MKLHGEFAPNGQDGYVPGAWDEVRRAVMDGHISPEAYDLLREALGDSITPRVAACRKCQYLAEGKWDGAASVSHDETCERRSDDERVR